MPSYSSSRLLAGEASHLSQQAEGQAGLQMQPVETGHVGFEGGGASQRLNRPGTETFQFAAAGDFKALGQNRHTRHPVVTSQRWLCSRSPLLTEWQCPVLRTR